MSAPSEVSESASTDEVDPPPARSRRRRRIALVLIGAVVLLIVGAGTAFLVKVATERALDWRGGVTYAVGSGATRHDDPFGAEPGGGWIEVAYQPGGTILIGQSITNISHTQTITIKSITFDGVAPSDGMMESSISKAVPGVDYDKFGGSTDVQPFHPFQLSPGQFVYIQWTLTMCPTGTADAKMDREEGFSTFDIDYTYFGFHKHEQLPLATPLQIDNVRNGCD